MKDILLESYKLVIVSKFLDKHNFFLLLKYEDIILIVLVTRHHNYYLQFMKISVLHLQILKVAGKCFIILPRISLRPLSLHHICPSLTNSQYI